MLKCKIEKVQSHLMSESHGPKRLKKLEKKN